MELVSQHLLVPTSLVTVSWVKENHSITVISGFDTQTRLVGHSAFYRTQIRN